MSEGHIRQRSAGSWEIRYTLGRDPLTGKRVTKTATVKGNKRDAQRELRKRLEAVDEGRHVDPGRITVAEYLESWLSDYARAAVSAKTFERYAELLRHHVIARIGVLPLAKLQPLAVQGAYTAMLADGRRDGTGGLSPRTVQHVHRVLKQAFRQAVRWRLLAVNPADAVEPPKVEEAEIQVLSQAEVGALLKATEGSRLYAPIVLALTTGMRRGELLGLRWSDVSLDRAELRVEQSLEQTKAGLRMKPPKTRRSRRTITLPAFTVAALRRHRAQQAEERLALGLPASPNALVFTRLDGEPLNPRNFTKSFSRLVGGAGLAHVTLHGLRHTHITQLLAAGEHVKVVSERAGHASVAVTLTIYAHVIPGMQAGVAERLDAVLRAVVTEPERLG